MNNILSLFHGYLSLLMDEKKLDPAMNEGLSRIREGAREATDLIERINAISRPASRMQREIDPADFFRQLAPTLDRMRTAQIQIIVECPAGLPAMCVDTSRMKLAMVELVRNACEAATAKVIIRVSAEKGAVQPELFPGGGAAPESEWVKIEVIDDGAGIGIAGAKRIYEPFYSTKNAAHATGLGLAVALGCAQQCGGTLQHRSKKGRTIFEMSLPARAPQQLNAVA